MQFTDPDDLLLSDAYVWCTHSPAACKSSTKNPLVRAIIFLTLCYQALCNAFYLTFLFLPHMLIMWFTNWAANGPWGRQTFGGYLRDQGTYQSSQSRQLTSRYETGLGQIFLSNTLSIACKDDASHEAFSNRWVRPHRYHDMMANDAWRSPGAWHVRRESVGRQDMDRRYVWMDPERDRIANWSVNWLAGQLTDQFQHLIIGLWVITALWRVKSNARDITRPVCALGEKED